MSYGSAGTSLTSSDIAELRKDADYHLNRAGQILSRIANRGDVTLVEFALLSNSIRSKLKNYLDNLDPQD
jgi:hypothetical protein